MQGELIARFLNPVYWGALWSPGWGRSELAADFYDEILFTPDHRDRRQLALLAEDQLGPVGESQLSFCRPAVDRLRAAAGTILLSSPEFNRLLKDVGARIIREPPAAGSTAGAP